MHESTPLHNVPVVPIPLRSHYAATASFNDFTRSPRLPSNALLAGAHPPARDRTGAKPKSSSSMVRLTVRCCVNRTHTRVGTGSHHWRCRPRGYHLGRWRWCDDVTKATLRIAFEAPPQQMTECRGRLVWKQRPDDLLREHIGQRVRDIAARKNPRARQHQIARTRRPQYRPACRPPPPSPGAVVRSDTGDTVEKKDAIEASLDELGCRNAPVTIDSQEWVFASAYRQAIRRSAPGCGV